MRGYALVRTMEKLSARSFPNDLPLNRKEEAVKRNSVIIGIVILLFVAGGSLKALASGGAPKVLKVKGLYLGMNIDKGARIIKEFITPKIAEKLGEGEPLEVARIPPFEECNYGFGYFIFGCPKIFLQSDCSEGRKVFFISIHNDIADEMFDAKQLSQEQFVQAFENAHGITIKPKVEPVTSRGSSSRSWEYESAHGYKVTIILGHTIIIEQVVKKSK
jgi:hypothetical protein